jgi:hypothetical protein
VNYGRTNTSSYLEKRNIHPYRLGQTALDVSTTEESNVDEPSLLVLAATPKLPGAISGPDLKSDWIFSRQKSIGRYVLSRKAFWDDWFLPTISNFLFETQVYPRKLHNKADDGCDFGKNPDHPSPTDKFYAWEIKKDSYRDYYTWDVVIGNLSEGPYTGALIMFPTNKTLSIANSCFTKSQKSQHKPIPSIMKSNLNGAWVST